MDDIPFAPGGVGASPSAEDAIRALAVLGFQPGDAERAVRAVIAEQGSLPTQDLIRAALARVR